MGCNLWEICDERQSECLPDSDLTPIGCKFVSKIKRSLEKSTKKEFKKLDEAKRKSWADSKNKVLD